MIEIKFSEPVVSGFEGRNGLADLGGLSVSTYSKAVSLVPLSRSGAQLRGRLQILASDCGEVACAIATEAARNSPELRERIAAQLRAALVTIETAADERPDDTYVSYYPPMGGR